MTTQIKQCSKCKENFSITQFHRDASKADGHRGYCKRCDAGSHLKWCSHNKRRLRKYKRLQYAKNPQAMREKSRSDRRKNRAWWLLRNARVRARVKGMAFDLDQHWAELKDRIDRLTCELSGVPLDVDSLRDWNSPSLDRINCKKGYTYDNVRVVCFAMNCALGTWGESKLRTVLESWRAK
jgi:hypothetical protein